MPDFLRYLKIDETPIRCLEPGNGKAATGYFWVYHHAEHGILFDWHKSRANTCLDTILIDGEGSQSFNGHLQSDGLRAYRPPRNSNRSCQSNGSRRAQQKRSPSRSKPRL